MANRREDLAWAAGFFDGEGCFTGARARSPRAQVSNTNLSQLERFQDVVGFGMIQHLRPSGVDARGIRSNKPLYHWRSSSYQHAQALGALLWEWLGEEKRRQFRAVQAIFRSRKPRPTIWCPHGHLYTDATTYRHVKKNGHVSRSCRICIRERARQRRQEARA